MQLQGKELSFNNIADTDAALECVKSFNEPACVIVKHANPCGVAIADSPVQAYQLAFKTDPTSAFGGIIAFNRELDDKTAQTIIEQQFTEVIIAPSIAESALEITKQKRTFGFLRAEIGLRPEMQRLILSASMADCSCRIKISKSLVMTI